MNNRADPAAGASDSHGHPAPASLWAFGPPDQEIRVGNADLLLAQLSIFLGGWPCRRLGNADQGDMDIGIVERPDKKFEIALAGASAPPKVFANEFDAADGLANGLVSAFIARQTDLLCLPASSVQLGSGLVVLLGDALSGKSSVAIHLAAAGYRLFGDDRLAVRVESDGVVTGLCLGLTPKVRLPLPPDCGQRFAEYVESFTEIRDESVAYLKLWEGEAAVFLERLPITAFVILNRAKTGDCAIAPASRPMIDSALQAQCSAPGNETQSLLPALSGLAAGIPGYELSFSRSDEAATLLSSTLRRAPE